MPFPSCISYSMLSWSGLARAWARARINAREPCQFRGFARARKARCLHDIYSERLARLASLYRGLRAFTDLSFVIMQLFMSSPRPSPGPCDYEYWEKLCYKYRKNHNFPLFIPVSPVWPGLSPGPDLSLPSLFGRDIKPILPLETKSWARPWAR